MIYDEQSQTVSVDRLKEIQSERLIKTVRLVYDNVQPYREKMDAAKLKPSDIRSVEDLYKLPFTVKRDLRENYPFGMFACKKRDLVRLHASSGTTGKFTVVGYTKEDLDTWANCTARALSAAGATEESIVQVSYGYGLFTGGLGLHYGVEKLGATVVPASGGSTKRQIMLMKDFGVDVLACTPSYAIYLAEEMKNEGVKKEELSLKAGLFGAEPWSEQMRKEIEDLLGLKAFDVYGLSEISGPGVAFECSMHDGLHVNEDNFIPEIVNPETLEPVKDGEKGELVFTTITKTGIPLIRYRTRDITSLTHEPCKCGRTFARISRIEGRSDDMLIIRGVNVFPSQIENVLLSVGGVEPQYNIVVDRINNLDVMEIQVEMSEDLMSDEVRKIEQVRKKIQSDMQSMLSVSANIKLVSPHSLQRTDGKANRITDKRII